MPKIYWLKISIFLIILVSLGLISLNLKAQTAPSSNTNMFCGKTEAVNLNVSQIINCDQHYHVEGNICAFNNIQPAPGESWNWLGNTFNGIMALGTICGNGVLEPGEECDDGNTSNNDACNNSCQWTVLAVSPIPCNVSNGMTIGSTTTSNVSIKGLACDTNNNTSGIVTDNGGNNMKVEKVIPTAYVWIADSLFSGCSPYLSNPQCDYISKISTGINTGESLGQWMSRSYSGKDNNGDNASDYADPSRTAVNVETGEAWVANRGYDPGGGNLYSGVTKYDINGNIKKTCYTGRGPRGLAIDKDGNVWVANAVENNVVKISGDNDSCSAIVTKSVGAYPYGLAIDSNDNIWISARFACAIQKIDTHNNNTLTSYTVPDCVIGSCTTASCTCGDAGYLPYGITVDLNGNVWAADTCTGVWKLNTSTGAVSHINLSSHLAHSYGRSRGVTIDTDGNIWIAFDYSAQAVKIGPDGNFILAASTVDIPVLGGTGTMPIGIVGDSLNRIWVVNYNWGSVSILNSVGTLLRTLHVNNGIPARPYTYSDMSGLNRAMQLRTGTWEAIFDGNSNDQHWGKLSWTQTPTVNTSQQSMKIEIGAGNTTSAINLVSADTWNSYANTSDSRKGHYLKIKISIYSSEVGITPIVTDLAIGP